MPIADELKLLSHDETVRAEALSHAVSFVGDTSTKAEDVIRVASIFERWIKNGDAASSPTQLAVVK
jgi:hypothetical protein